VAVTTGKWSSIPGSEPSFALRARVTTTVDRLAGQYPGQRIAVVSHGGAINAYLAAILGIERDYFFPAANTSISVVRVQGDRHMLLTLNDIGHLRESGLIDWK
jgi:probable phosphoglycerate mutase